MNGRRDEPEAGRGNPADRRSRTAWLITHFDTNLGPWTCLCHWCKAKLGWTQVVSDRFCPGAADSFRCAYGGTEHRPYCGRYVRDNLNPSCGQCNDERGNNIDWRYQGERPRTNPWTVRRPITQPQILELPWDTRMKLLLA